MSSAFDAFYDLGSSKNERAKGRGRRRRRRDIEIESEAPETPTVHKKKVHALGNSQTITIDNVRIEFPLKPYPAQIQMMNKIIRALNRGENALLESPTGSGKSLALLCAAIAWKEDQERKIAADKANATLPKRELELPMDKAEQLSKKIKYSVKTRVVEEEDDDFQQPIHKRFIAEKMIKPADTLIDIESAIEQIVNAETKPENTKRIPTIYVGSRTHKQITQLLAELKSNTRYSPRTAVLGSRDHLCIHPRVSKSTNKADDCTKLLDTKSCRFFHNKQKLIGHRSLSTTDRIWDIEDLISLGKRTQGCPYYASRKIAERADIIFSPYNYIIDPVIRKALDINLKDSIIILDEAHNIEDASRSAGSFETDEESFGVVMLELNLVIKFGGAQEAHKTIEGVIGQVYDMMTSNNNHYFVKEYERHSCHFTGDELLARLNAINITPYLFNDVLLPAFKEVADHAKEVRKQMEESSTNDVLDSINLDDTQEPGDGVQVKRIRCLSNGSLTILEGIFTALTFIFDPNHEYADDYQMVLMRTMNRTNANKRKKRNAEAPDSPPKPWVHKLAFWCMNPAVIFRDMSKDTHSVILTSGTLSPLNTFASELGIEFTGRLEANHVIKPLQVWVGAIPRGPNHVTLKGVYSTLETFHYQDEVGQTLLQLIETIPYGVLCFMPSYKALDILMERWKLTGALDKMKERKMIFSEPKGGDKNAFEGILNQFYNQIDKVESGEKDGNCDGALFFAVFRGKVSEGIDFNDNYCRAVVALGIPFPGFKDLEVILKKEYNNRMRLKSNNKQILSGSEWYSAQAYRAINQALGRCIRHKNDWGAIILLEERFSNAEHVNGLSKWVRGQFKVQSNYANAMEGLKHFVEYQFQEMESQKRKLEEVILIKEEDDQDRSDVKVEAKEEMIESVDEGVASKYFTKEVPAAKEEPIDPPIPNPQPAIDQHDSSIDDISLPPLSDIQNTNADSLPINIESGHGENGNTIPQQAKISAVMMPPPPMPVRKQTLLCNICSEHLMSGPSDNLKIAHIFDLQSLLSIARSPIIVELCRPGMWELSFARLMGGPLAVDILPPLCDVIYDRNDGICYRLLFCVCDKTQPLGVVVCAAIDPLKKHHVGKVYLWNCKDSTPHVAETISQDDLNKEVPNSQYSSSNDIFYGL